MAGQIGPSFLDLQLITNVSLDRASAFFTAGGVGYLTGSLLTGYVFDRIKDKVFVVFISVVGMGVTTAAIPFCYIYELMVFVQLVRGITCGGLDTSGNTLLSRTWGSHGRMIMQALHFGFALGGALSPLALAPFLTTERSEIDPLNLTKLREDWNNSAVSNTSEMNNDFRNNSTPSNWTARDNKYDGESTLYIAYAITAAMIIGCSFPAFVISIQNRRMRKHEKKKKLENNLQSDHKREAKHHVKITKRMKTMVTINLVLCFMFSVATEESFTAFLSTFCVRELKWTKMTGALITSVFWGAFALGRLAGIILVMVLSPSTLIFVYATLEVLSLFAILISVSLQFSTGMWIFSPVVGFAMSLIFPCMFTWTEVSFMPITGRLSSLFMVVTCIASSINPIYLGEIMDRFSNMWFIYLLTGEAVVFYMFFIIAFYVSKERLKEEKNTQDMAIEIKDIQ
ncbi:hypothetical protein FSP39_016710 [Pinctada imbricata]|uniref:Uncharacterized protein n=1 Tax=Pinctada imbricata TaxID=66713 RepID=A0AA88YU82_PINIB|nr:hypothetical protein FSP39_016710 [Pinctada imbricata]